VAPDAHDISLPTVGVHGKNLRGPVVEDRDDDALAAWQRLAYLDLAITSVEPAVQPEDPPRLRRAANRDSRALTDRVVSSLDVPAALLDATKKERRHLRRSFGGRGG
jgi:hypothetical protein